MGAERQCSPPVQVRDQMLEDGGTMARRGRGRIVWLVVAVCAVVAFVWFSDQVMTWLRVTIHGR